MLRLRPLQARWRSNSLRLYLCPCPCRLCLCLCHTTRSRRPSRSSRTTASSTPGRHRGRRCPSRFTPSTNHHIRQHRRPHTGPDFTRRQTREAGGGRFRGTSSTRAARRGRIGSAAVMGALVVWRSVAVTLPPFACWRVPLRFSRFFLCLPLDPLKLCSSAGWLSRLRRCVQRQLSSWPSLSHLLRRSPRTRWAYSNSWLSGCFWRRLGAAAASGTGHSGGGCVGVGPAAAAAAAAAAVTGFVFRVCGTATCSVSYSWSRLCSASCNRCW